MDTVAVQCGLKQQLAKAKANVVRLSLTFQFQPSHVAQTAFDLSPASVTDTCTEWHGFKPITGSDGFELSK